MRRVQPNVIRFVERGLHTDATAGRPPDRSSHPKLRTTRSRAESRGRPDDERRWPCPIARRRRPECAESRACTVRITTDLRSSTNKRWRRACHDTRISSWHVLTWSVELPRVPKKKNELGAVRITVRLTRAARRHDTTRAREHEGPRERAPCVGCSRMLYRSSNVASSRTNRGDETQACRFTTSPARCAPAKVRCTPATTAATAMPEATDDGNPERGELDAAIVGSATVVRRGQLRSPAPRLVDLFESARCAARARPCRNSTDQPKKKTNHAPSV